MNQTNTDQTSTINNWRPILTQMESVLHRIIADASRQQAAVPSDHDMAASTKGLMRLEQSLSGFRECVNKAEKQALALDEFLAEREEAAKRWLLAAKALH
jgi:hypothetical protein